MRRGELSFLTSRPPDEAWPVLKKLFREESYVLRWVARRLGVHDVTLWRWLKKNPDYWAELKNLRKESLAKGVD